MPIVLEQLDSPTADARALIGELDAELNGVYAPDQRHGLSIDRVFQPGVLFVIARLDGDPVGCGAVAFDKGDPGNDRFAEVKRMYVRPRARGRGVARAVLDHLAAAARDRGVTRLVLETGDAQHAAIRFYEREGFTRCAAFGAYLNMPPSAVERSVFYEKQVG